MKIDAKNLPTNVNILHQIVIDLLLKNETLEHQLAVLKKQQFGNKSEKLKEKIEEIELRLEDSEALSKVTIDEQDEALTEVDEAATDVQKDAATSDTGQSPKKERLYNAKRKPLPDNLPTDVVNLSAPQCCPECGCDKTRKIGEDSSEELNYIPASFRKTVYVRQRVACTSCDKVFSGEVASKPIAKGKAGAGLLAHILVQKYANHLPLYRQSEIYKREGIELSRSTMSSWAGQCSRLLEPLIARLNNYVFESEVLHCDDTVLKVLAPSLGKTKTGRIWVYVKDGKNCKDISPPAVIYYYSPDRKKKRPEEHLVKFKGILSTDAYSGLANLYESDPVRSKEIDPARCWAHVRRKFYEVTTSNPKANIAFEAINRIGKIYEIESQIRGSSEGERKSVRAEKSKPLVDDFFKFLLDNQPLLSKSGETFKAMNYALKIRASLEKFLSDGRVEIDNNIAERAIRSIAIGRKNWLFAGSDQGGATAASIFSLIETAKMNKLDPFWYLNKVLTVIQDYNSQKLDELLPWNIKCSGDPLF